MCDLDLLTFLLLPFCYLSLPILSVVIFFFHVNFIIDQQTLKKHIFLQHEFLMESGGEPLYAQINRELKTKRLNSATNTLTKSDTMKTKQIYYHVGTSKTYVDVPNYENKVADNRTDTAKLQNSSPDSSIYYKNLNNNNNTNLNTNTEQNQWV